MEECFFTNVLTNLKKEIRGATHPRNLSGRCKYPFSPTPMTDALSAVNVIGSGALSAATGIAAGPAGSMLYIGLGAAFLLAIAGLVIYFIRQIKA